MNNKRGQGLSTNTIIMVILGIIVLVILVLGFTIGWDRFLPFLKSNNVDNIKSGCSIACSTNNQYDYCVLSRTLKTDDISDRPGAGVGNCSFFSTDENYILYGIDECPSLCD